MIEPTLETANRSGPLKAQLQPLAIAFIFTVAGTILGAWVSHTLDRSNWERQHREERVDVRRKEAAVVFDTAMISFARISTGINAVLWGLQTHVSKDSATTLLAVYDAHVRELENQLPRLESLIRAYFDPLTLHQFHEAVSTSSDAEDQVKEDFQSPANISTDPSKLRAFMSAVLTLGEHMAAQVAPDTTK